MKNPYFLQAFMRNCMLPLYICCFHCSYGQQQLLSPEPRQTEWSVNRLFINDVFIENKGQFDFAAQHKEPVLYGVESGNTRIYFTKKGLIFCLKKKQRVNWEEEKEREREKAISGKLLKKEQKFNLEESYDFIEATWHHANPNTEIQVINKTNDYYTYPTDRTSGEAIKAQAFRKLLYKNLYPGIDVEYSLNCSDSAAAIKYNIVLHPGAEPNLLSLHYSGHKKLRLDQFGNLLIHTKEGIIQDKAPVSYYLHDENNIISSSFKLHHNQVSFILKNYDNTREVVIDPWMNSTLFTQVNKGYHIRADYHGNCYVLGGDNGSFQVKKLNSSGTVLWTYTTAISLLGDIAVTQNGTVFVAGMELPTNGTMTLNGKLVTKLNSQGQNIATLNAGTQNGTESFRLSYNQKKNSKNLFVGTGASNSIASSDTSFSTPVIYAPYAGNLASGHAPDVVYLAQDENETELFVTVCWDKDNMKKFSINNLSTASWTSSDQSAFKEVCQATFIPTVSIAGIPTPPSATGSNGLNGMIVCNGKVYTFDGLVLKRWDATNGALLNSVNVPSGTFNAFSGIDKDNCCNIYVGVNGKIYKYNADLSSSSSITTNGDVYDLQLDPINPGKIYVTGKGYAQLIDNSTPCVNCISATGTDISGCNWGSATVTITDPAAVAPYTYQWNTNPVQNSQTIAHLQAGTYIVTVMDNAPCPHTWTDTVMIAGTYVACDDTLTATGGAICSGACLQLKTTFTGSLTNASYSWQPGNLTTASPLVCPTLTTTYTLTLTTPAGETFTDTAEVKVIATSFMVTVNSPSVCPGEPVQLTANGASTYEWQVPGSSTILTTNPITVNPQVSTTYTVTGISNGCKDTALSVVTVKPSPHVILASDSICIGESITLTPSGATNYIWSTGATTSSIAISPASTSNIYVVGSDPNFNCKDTAFSTITVFPLPVVSIISDSICNGETAHITAFGALTYSWPPGVQSTGGNNATCSPANTQTYTVTGYNKSCSDTSRFTVFVLPPPVADFSGGTNGCVPHTVTYHLTTPAISTATWNFGDGASAISANPLHVYNSPGTYSVQLMVKDVNGCADTLTKTNLVTVYPMPKAVLETQQKILYETEPVTDFVNSSSGSITNCSMFYGDGSMDNKCMNVFTHEYRKAGKYCAWLKVSTQYQCTDSASLCIEVKPDYSIYIPNSFSPNNDGHNDFFITSCYNINEFNLKIFSRWGELIFETDDFLKAWDGKKLNGKSDETAQEDVYVYTLEAKDINNMRHRFSGTITLIK